MKYLGRNAFLFFLALVINLAGELLFGGKGITLLYSVLFWLGLSQGAVALVAVSELARGKWLQPIKKELLSVYPMIFFSTICFGVLILVPGFCPWKNWQIGWYSKELFLTRNIIALVSTFLLAGQFASQSLSDGPRKILFAVLYILSFVASQSFVAFDWVMFLEYPWYSTLFGGYFFIQSIYSGIAFGGVICFLLLKKKENYSRTDMRKTLRDIGSMAFGFSLFTGYLFFSQLLVIWYGNIPEETKFIFARISRHPFLELSVLAIVAMFILPFFVLLLGWTRSHSGMVLFISISILIGLLVERFVFLSPNVSINGIGALLQFTCMAWLFISYLLRSVVQAADSK
jgi:hypothetical protein